MAVAVSSWFTMVAAIYFQMTADSKDTFSIYKAEFGFGWFEIQLLWAARNLGASLGFLTDLLYSKLTNVEGNARKNLRVCIVYLIGAAFLAVGYLLVRWFIGDKEPGFHVILFFAMVIAGQGQNVVTTANLMVFAVHFPNNGAAVGIIQAYSSFGSYVFILLNDVFFKGSPRMLLVSMAVLPAIISIFFAAGLAFSNWRNNQELNSDGYLLKSFGWCGVFAAFWITVMKGVNFPNQNVAAAGGTQLDTIATVAAGPNPTSGDPVASTQNTATGDDAPIRYPIRERILILVPEAMNICYLLLLFAAGSSLGTYMVVSQHIDIFSKPYGYSKTSNKNLVSIWSGLNFIGNICGGLLSDRICKRFGYSRVWVIACSQILMIIGNFVCAFAPTLLYGMVLLAFASGVVGGVVPNIVCELFGIENFRTNYNNIRVVAAIVAFGLKFIAKSEKASVQNCHGNKCFQALFIISAVVCLGSMIVAVVMIYINNENQQGEEGTGETGGTTDAS
uniref:uncharacterized protein LOC122602970 n=1 Tax=Erigeron canadensis TaxID=72917 RepID=UPI001CB9BE6D|nr:uncharacterized protein LOC122602970 [Erigeron canadensis]